MVPSISAAGSLIFSLYVQIYYMLWEWGGGNLRTDRIFAHLFGC